MTSTITSVVGVILLAALVCGLPQNSQNEDVFDVMDKSVAGKCGIANKARIVGGIEVTPKHKYPWYVGIGNTKNSDGYYCGGTIINQNYVITAAHCFFDPNGGRLSDDGLKVGVADHDQWDASDDVSATEFISVAKVIVHPVYDPYSYDNDIALLKLSKELDFSQKEVKPVCLPDDDSKTYAGQTGHAYGWGALEYRSSPAKLQEVELPIIETKDDMCLDVDGITERMLCAGYKEGGKDTCQGDSGGPLTVIENGKHNLVGIVSYRYSCAEPNSPGVYTRVTKFLQWIKETTA